MRGKGADGMGSDCIYFLSVTIFYPTDKRNNSGFVNKALQHLTVAMINRFFWKFDKHRL